MLSVCILSCTRTRFTTTTTNTTVTLHHDSNNLNKRVGSLSQGHPGLCDTPVGPGRTPTVHGGRPWVARVEEISRRHCFCVFRLFLFVCALWNNDSRCPSGGRRPSGAHVLHQRSGRVQEPSNQDSLERRQPHAGVSCCRRHCRRLL